MRKLVKSKWFPIVLALAMILTLLPAMAVAENNNNEDSAIEANIGFIPNSDESSVSKVDLVNNLELARYSTVPDRDAVNLLDARPNRIDIDSDGNAWVLNSMSTTRSGFVWQDAQGSVVRISASPVDGEDPGNTTSNSSTMVEGDVRVSIIDIGAPGDGPRTIDVVEDGDDLYLWIGFYGGRYYEKYAFDPDATDPENMLEAVPGTKIDVADYTPYSTARDGDILWVSAVASSNPFTGVSGIFAIDMTAPEDGYYAGPFAFDPPDGRTSRPYDIKIAPDGKAWVSDATPGWTSTHERFFGVYDSDGIVKYVSIGSGSTAMRGFYIDEDGTVWATTANGRLLKGTYDSAQAENYGWTFEAVRTGLGELTGIGADASGYLWLIRYGSDDIARVNPDSPGDALETIDVGLGPYAYANFFTVPQTGCLSVEKVWEGYDEVIGFDEDTMIPDEIDILIKGPSFDADYPDGKPFTLKAEDDWSLEVCDLDPGDYFVYEDAEEEDWYDLWDVDVDPESVTVEAGDDPEVNLVTITNEYQPGCLEITKEWFYGDLYFDDEVPESITVLIEGPSFDPDGEEVTLDAPDWSYVTCDVLIPGEYTVTELDVDSDFWSVFYVVGEFVCEEAGVVYVEPGERATVNINNYFLFKDDTFWAYGEDEELGGAEGETANHNNKVDDNPSNAWGWTNKITAEGEYTWDLWASAGQNILENGYKVGTLTVEVTEDNGEFCATVTYDVFAQYEAVEYHLWVGDTPLPTLERGGGRNVRTVATAAPGQLRSDIGEEICGLSGDGFYVAAHGVVRVGFEPAIVESVIFNDADGSGCFGTAVGDEVVITFAKDIYKADDIIATFSNVQWSILSAGARTDYDITDNVLTFTVNEEFTNPRCIEGEKLISILGLEDEYGDPVFLPVGGVEVITP